MYSNCPPVKKQSVMKTQVTYERLMVLLSVIVVPCFIWIINAEKKFEQVIKNTTDIEKVKYEIREEAKARNENYLKILEEVTVIKIELQNKKDREK